VAQALPRIFLHAFCSDGTISSICRRCQMIIASKPNEIDLRNPEGAHVCLESSLRRMFRPERVADAGK